MQNIYIDSSSAEFFRSVKACIKHTPTQIFLNVIRYYLL